MDRDELARIASRNRSTTLVAVRLRDALGLPQPKAQPGSTRDRSAKSRKYRGARRLMRQRRGVRP